ncbi:hypothetical protein B4Q13_22660, partial [Lacticaseibacillus rhamnosus]
WVGRPATELTLQAWCGSTGNRGLPDGPPIAAGGRVGEWIAGTYAAVGALTALRSGHGEHVDVQDGSVPRDVELPLGEDVLVLAGFVAGVMFWGGFNTALEVFVANDVETFIDAHDGYTPTPVISHAILAYNRGRATGRADGVVITPSHNPPEDGGFKYNPPNGGPADTDVTGAIERWANELLAGHL